MTPNLPEKHLLPDYSKKEILDELDRILTSDLFSRSSVLTNFLKYIVEETLKGNNEELKEYNIAVNALGKSDDFNPQIDAIVRIHAGRLRRLLNEYYMGPGIKDPINIGVVKGTYVPVFRPHLINKSKTETENETKTETNVNTNQVVFSRSKLTLAVLPFRNLCQDGEYQFFVDGFGEELTRIFSTFEDIAIVAHHSTLRYANTFEDIRVIGSDLGVHYLLNGSVKRSDKQIRVSVGLLETMNGTQIWSKTYTHDLDKDEFIAIQDQIDEDIFSVLSGQYGFILHNTMSVIQHEMDTNLQTFDAILWNYYAQKTHSIKDCQKSRKALEKALQNDPNNVMCLVVLGDTYLFTHSLGYPNIKDPINEAVKLIKKAIRLAPLSQYAYLIYGWANIYLGNKEEAINALDYSIELGPPSASFNGQLGFALACVGDYKRAKALLHESLALNPYCPWWYYMGFFFVYYQNHKYKEALMYAQKIHVSEDVFVEPLFKAAAMGQLGLIEEAKTHVEILTKKFADILPNLNTFLLDKTLIDEIIEGAKKAGLTID
ncbi:MAG: hypothetical protein M0Q90_13310 [Bacteroidales bacterium]|nr:hypothetical protein [Bacteroidales bacterium]